MIINYVPGWGYVWLLFWSFASLTLVTISVIKQHLGLLVLALSSLLYWLVWLVIPYVGYCWFFAWRYVDAVAWQERAVLPTPSIAFHGPPSTDLPLPAFN